MALVLCNDEWYEGGATAIVDVCTYLSVVCLLKLGDALTPSVPVVNKEELLELDGVIREDPQFKLRWNHVRGHQGIEGNELADELAKMGARKKLSETQ